MSEGIEALIARLEKAEEPDRELDEAIAVLTYPALTTMSRTEIGGWNHPEFGRIAPPSYYTASIDAALTLVPEGWHVSRFETRDPTLKHHRDYVNISPHNKNDIGWTHGVASAKAATPALALCIAALRSRIAAKVRA